MRRFHLALAAILAYVAGFGKNVVPFPGLWTWGGFFGIRPQPVKGSWEERTMLEFGFIRLRGAETDSRYILWARACKRWMDLAR